jgi:hypothetical protein
MDTTKKVYRKAFVTLATNEYLDVLELSRITFKRYSEIWEYDYFEFKENLDESRPDAWSKLLAVRGLLDQYDFVLYVDSDAIILDYEFDLEQVIPKEKDFAWVICQTKNGAFYPNAGVLGCRSNQKIKNMIELAYEQRDLIFNGWWEQAALMRVLRYDDVRIGETSWRNFNLPDPDVNVYELPTEWNTTIFDLHKKPIIRHFAGDPLYIKVMLMSDYLLQYHRDMNLETHEMKEKVKNSYEMAKTKLVAQGQSRVMKLRMGLLVWLLKFRMIRKIKWR